MSENIAVIKKALELMADGVPFACAVVSSQEGSAPAAEGARMLITPGESHGTIGGGALEWMTTILARKQVLPGKTGVVKDFDLAEDAACGGKCQVSIAYIAPGDGGAERAFKALLEAEEAGLDRLYIFGGGHVAAEVAPLALRCGWRVTVIDDRAEFASRERFPGCETVTAPEYDALPEIPQGSRTYIVIMTRGHSFDEKVLTRMAGLDCRYLGMMGSRSKKGALYKNIIDRGEATAEQLEAVHCPIGFSIGAQTPAEIAVSVAAELVAARYEKL